MLKGDIIHIVTCSMHIKAKHASVTCSSGTICQAGPFCWIVLSCVFRNESHEPSNFRKIPYLLFLKHCRIWYKEKQEGVTLTLKFSVFKSKNYAKLTFWARSLWLSPVFLPAPGKKQNQKKSCLALVILYSSFCLSTNTYCQWEE